MLGLENSRHLKSKFAYLELVTGLEACGCLVPLVAVLLSAYLVRFAPEKYVPALSDPLLPAAFCGSNATHFPRLTNYHRRLGAR